MAYNPTAITEFKDGNTPSTGTLALGSLFEAEFDQLYGNWQEFFGVAGTQLTVDTGAFGTASIKGASGVVHIANGTNADTNWYPYAQLVVESNDNGAINIRTPNNKQGQIVFSNPDATNAGILDFNHNTNAFSYFLQGAAKFNVTSTGMFIGGSTAASNLLHIQGTTTPQFRIAYDSDSYYSFSVASDGDLTIQAGEATGRIRLYPGASDPSITIYSAGATASLYLMSSDAGEYLTVYHNGSNGYITTAGTSAGNIHLSAGTVGSNSIIIDNTTESTSTSTGALIVSGGAAFAYTVTAGYGFNGRKQGVLAQITSATTQDAIYDAYAGYFPEVGVNYQMTGGAWSSSGVHHEAIYCSRSTTGTGRLTFAFLNQASGLLLTYTADNGNATAIGITMRLFF